jgi:hypothetical protein
MRAARVLGWLAVLALAAGLVAGFGIAPREVAQGNVQRIMYLHLPSILAGYLAFSVAGAASIAYLVTSRPRWDRCAAAAAEIGVLFGVLMIASGSIWGRPTWGVWWTWDARLTSTAVLVLTWVGYLLLRAMVEDADARARFACAAVHSVAENPEADWRTTTPVRRAISRPSDAKMEVAAAVAMASEWPRELSGALTASLSRMYQAGMTQGRGPHEGAQNADAGLVSLH